MSSKQKTWFKSVFVTPASTPETPTKIADDPVPYTKRPAAKKRAAVSAIFNHTALDATIDLTADDKSSTTAKNNHAVFHPKVALSHPDAVNWLDNFAPRTVEDLAIHPKKIDELRDWLHQCTAQRAQRPAPILCISGPAGAGKTASLRLVAHAAGYDVQEWVQPVDVELACVSRRGDFGGDVDGPAFAESQSVLFEQFLLRASRYASLFTIAGGNNTLLRRLVLVEDFPNVFVKDAEGFSDVLERYGEYGKSPLVFIVTDSRSRKLDLGYTLFGDATRAKYGIATVAFNAVSATLLKRGLKRIASIMALPAFVPHYKAVTADAVDSIVLTAQGDLRNAMINMHVAAQKGVCVATTSVWCMFVVFNVIHLGGGKMPTQGGGPGKRTRKGGKLKSLGCDETITLMHALGRVLNPKYSEEQPDRLQHSPEQLADEFTSQPSNFVNLLYANYACHFRDIDTVLNAIDALSSTDVLLSEWRDDALAQIALNVGVRGVMTANRTPASGWHRIRGRRKETASGVEEELRRQFGIGRAVTARVMASDYRTFARVIADRGRQASNDGGGAAVELVNPDDEETKLMEQSIVW